MRRLPVPGVVLQVALGVILAAVGFGIEAPILEFLGGVGLVLMLFSAGRETDAAALLRCGKRAGLVAVLGVLLSFLGGAAVAAALGWSLPAAMFAGGVLSATSVAISAQVLGSCGWLSRDEGRVVLGAAVADDVVGLVILGLVVSVFSSDPASASSATVFGRAVLAVIVVLGALLLGLATGKRYGEGPRSHLMHNLLATAACLVGVAVARVVGLEAFLGGFLAGMVLPAGAPGVVDVPRKLGVVLAPLYFVLLGAEVEVRSIGEPEVIFAAVAFFVAGSLAKLGSGLGGEPHWDRLAIGLAMIPRGEVGLVFAAAGLAAGALSEVAYAELVGAVLASSVIGPWMLALRTRRKRDPKAPLSPVVARQLS